MKDFLTIIAGVIIFSILYTYYKITGFEATMIFISAIVITNQFEIKSK